MAKFFKFNFRQGASERAARYSSMVYGHYNRMKPYLSRVVRPIKQIREKYWPKKFEISS